MSPLALWLVVCASCVAGLLNLHQKYPSFTLYD
jgi:hypothetical protein